MAKSRSGRQHQDRVSQRASYPPVKAVARPTHTDYKANGRTKRNRLQTFDRSEQLTALLKRAHHQRPVVARTEEPGSKPDHFFVVLGIPATQTTHTRNLIVSLTRGNNGFYRFQDFRMHIASRGTDIRRKVARTYMHDID